LLGGSAKADEREEQREFVGVLIDTTRCLGCRSCEFACAAANGLPEPDADDPIGERKQTPTQLCVVNRYETDIGEVYVKKQCMHCAQPACASACLTKAMLKTERGPVVWREEKCMGCRFCMISCPFDGPKFEYDSPNPKIQKCTLCWERLQKGEKPACVEECPGEALLFGNRRELLDVAKTRIYSEPDRYVHEIYGEHEVGGTGVLYLAGVPFEQLGFRTNVGTTPYPELTKEFLYGVPIVITLWPMFLLALNSAKNARQEADSGTIGKEAPQCP
jgi:Fe-S-cluster-containing dehydrogenase component